MLEDYIKEIVKNEIAKDNLNKHYGKNGTSVYDLYMKEKNLNKENEKLKFYLKKSNDFAKFLEQENQELKESLEKQKQRQYETNEFWSQQKIADESEKLKQENIHLNKRLDEYSKTLLEAIKIKDFLQEENEKLKNENKKSKKKLCIIKGIIHVQHNRTYTNDNLMTTIKLIEDNIKES